MPARRLRLASWRDRSPVQSRRCEQKHSTPKAKASSVDLLVCLTENSSREDYFVRLHVSKIDGHAIGTAFKKNDLDTLSMSIVSYRQSVFPAKSEKIARYAQLQALAKNRG